jgi:hypothetical protein
VIRRRSQIAGVGERRARSCRSRTYDADPRARCNRRNSTWIGNRRSSPGSQHRSYIKRRDVRALNHHRYADGAVRSSSWPSECNAGVRRCRHLLGEDSDIRVQRSVRIVLTKQRPSSRARRHRQIGGVRAGIGRDNYVILNQRIGGAGSVDEIGKR